MKLAIVFPGQGSQSVGMLTGYDEYPEVQTTLIEAGSVLGQDLWTLAAEGPSEQLNQTVNTQPLMLAADVAVYRAWRGAGGVAPAIVAGHSLGEYAALVVAGALQLADALPLVRLRAQAMQEAVPTGVGAMAAIMGIDDAGIAAACANQAASPGRWVETVQAFVAAGATHILECGPGQVLTGLCKRIAPDLAVMPMNDGAAIESALSATSG